MAAKVSTRCDRIQKTPGIVDGLQNRLIFSISRLKMIMGRTIAWNAMYNSVRTSQGIRHGKDVTIESPKRLIHETMIYHRSEENVRKCNWAGDGPKYNGRRPSLP